MKVGDKVVTALGTGFIVDIGTLRETIEVVLDGRPGSTLMEAKNAWVVS